MTTAPRSFPASWPPATSRAPWGRVHPSERFNLRLSPLSPRVTLVRRPERFRQPPADTAIYGVAPGFSTDSGEPASRPWRSSTSPGPQRRPEGALRAVRGLRPAPAPGHLAPALDLTITAKVNNVIGVSLGGIVLYDYRQDRSFQGLQPRIWPWASFSTASGRQNRPK
ncbi:MAG: hypothetical protein WKG07_23190 [Hymenobacter sp.]